MNKIDVTEYRVYTDKILTNENLKVVQLSDLHSTLYENNNQMLIKLIEKEKPNIIVATGDMINRTDDDFKVTLDFLKRLTQKYIVYYSYGNHEIYNKYVEIENVEKQLSDIGVKPLDNEGAYISENVYLCGIPYQATNKHKFKESSKNFLNKLNEKQYNILLAHNPDCFEEYVKYNTDLILSGHIHGGEIRILKKGLLSPNRTFFPKYSAGIYVDSDSNKSMIVSRGLGDCTFKFRINNNPEIVVINLIGKKSI